eukprot:1240032-Rhodomonas_salina.1
MSEGMQAAKPALCNLANCTHPACPQTHSWNICRCSQQCSRFDCVFVHPWDYCRFGVGCTNAACQYIHPAASQSHLAVPRSRPLQLERKFVASPPNEMRKIAALNAQNSQRTVADLSTAKSVVKSQVGCLLLPLQGRTDSPLRVKKGATEPTLSPVQGSKGISLKKGTKEPAECRREVLPRRVVGFRPDEEQA